MYSSWLRSEGRQGKKWMTQTHQNKKKKQPNPPKKQNQQKKKTKQKKRKTHQNTTKNKDNTHPKNPRTNTDYIKTLQGGYILSSNSDWERRRPKKKARLTTRTST